MAQSEARCVAGFIASTSPRRRGPLVQTPMLAIALRGVIGSIDASWEALPDLIKLDIQDSNISGAP